MCEASLLAGPGAKRILLAHLMGSAPEYLRKCMMDVCEMAVAEMQQVCVYTEDYSAGLQSLHKHRNTNIWGPQGELLHRSSRSVYTQGLRSRLATIPYLKDRSVWGPLKQSYGVCSLTPF